MIEVHHKTKRGQRVALKHDRADVYISAFGGSEGWVRDQRVDQGFPMVFIEWDQRHWAYNGESNMWTFEDHFDIVKEDMSDQPPKDDKEAIATALEVLSRALLGGESNPQPREPRAQPNDADALLFHADAHNPQQYIENVGKAHEVASNADAFILIAVKADDDINDAEAILMTPSVISSYRNPMAGLFAETQLSYLAATTHDKVNLLAIRRLSQEDES